MNLYLTGVLLNGPPEAGQPNPRKTLEVTRMTDTAISIKVVTADGIPTSIAGATFQLAVRRTFLADPVLLLTATGVGYSASFTLIPTDTVSIDAGRYIYDVEMTREAKRDVVVPVSPFILQDTAQPPPV